MVDAVANCSGTPFPGGKENRENKVLSLLTVGGQGASENLIYIN